MSNYNSQLQSNNLDLQTVLQTLQTKAVAFEAGKKAEYDAFWDAAQRRNGVPVTYIPYAFAGPTWTDDNFKPKYDITAKGNSHGIFRQTSMVNLKQCLETSGVTLDLSQATGLTGVFGYSGHLKILPKLDISSVTTAINLFSSATALESIDELNVSAKTTFDTCFYNCAALKHMIVTGTIGKNGFDVQWSTLLDKESIISIVNALSTTTSNFSITLSQIAVNTAFETSAGAADGSTSSEWTTLAGTKSNWTINLV